jgi:hypothetical protein
VIVSVSRSPLRMLAYALIAVPMILLSVDMLVSYRFYPHPETTAVSREVTGSDGSAVQTEEQVYTQVGQSQRRRDVAWGTVLLAGGAVTLVWAFGNLIHPRRLLVAEVDGLTLKLGKAGEPSLRLQWEEIAELRSGVREGEAGPVPVLSLRLFHAEEVPLRPRGAIVDPPWIHLLAEEWDRPAHEVAALLDGYVEGAGDWESYG